MVLRGTRVAARFRTAADGQFSVWLVPGSYLVRWVGGQFGQDQPVEVVEPETAVTLHFDTGIR
jgi:hypothetical protein